MILPSKVFLVLVSITCTPAWGAALSADGNQLWNLDTAGIPGSSEDVFGWGLALATGDFNGDGYPDLLVSPAERTDWHKVHVFYGTASGITADNSELIEPYGLDAFAVGDFNNDGKDDLAVGDINRRARDCEYFTEPLTNTRVYTDPRGCSNGAVDIFYGTGAGLPEYKDETWHQDKSGIKSVAEGWDYFGTALASGDFDGDGYADLAIGVPGEDLAGDCDRAADWNPLETVCEAGAVQVIYGGSNGLYARDQLWHQNKDGIKGTAEAEDHFGKALTVGDFNGDGRDDLAIGVPHEDIGFCGFEGAFYVCDAGGAGGVQILYGGSDGLTSHDQFYHQDTSSIQGGAEEEDQFGEVLAAGDFDGDGYSDLAVGVPRENLGWCFNAVGDRCEAGLVQVIYGSSDGLTKRDQVWHQDTAGIKGSAERGDHFGASLAAGDFDADGHDDLAIGVPYEDLGSCTRNFIPVVCSAAGAVQVLYGDSGGLTSRDQIWHQDKPGIQGGAGIGRRFGSALVAGQFNAQYQADLVIGVPNDKYSHEGAVQLLFGAGGEYAPDADAGLAWFLVAGVDGTADVTLDGSGSSDPLGSPLTFEWAWDGGIASGVTPTVNLPVGHAEITLTVTNDVGGIDTDTTFVEVIESSSVVLGPPPVFQRQPGDSVSGQPLDPQPTVLITDVEGNRAITFNGTVTLELVDELGCGGALLGALAVSAVQGVAVFDGLSIDATCEAYVLRAIVPDLPAGESEPFAVIAEPPVAVLDVWTVSSPLCVPGGDVDVSLQITNTANRTLNLVSLADTVWGDLSPVCEIPQRIKPGGFYHCTFPRSITQFEGFIEIHSVTASFEGFAQIAEETLEISVHPLPEPLVIPAPTATIYEGSSLLLDIDGEFDSFLWSTGETAPNISVTESGDYSVIVTDSNDCSAMSAATTVMVVPPPVVPTLSAGGVFLLWVILTWAAHALETRRRTRNSWHHEQRPDD